MMPWFLENRVLSSIMYVVKYTGRSMEQRGRRAVGGRAVDGDKNLARVAFYKIYW